MVKRNHTKLEPNFGIYHIHIQRLLSGELTVQRSRYTTAFPAELVSSIMRDSIVSLIRNKKLDSELFVKLDDQETRMLINLIKRSHIDDNILLDIANMSPDRRERRDQLIHKLNIKKGEIIAGNDNPELRDDIKKILSELKEHGWIPIKTFNQLTEDFT